MIVLSPEVSIAIASLAEISRVNEPNPTSTKTSNFRLHVQCFFRRDFGFWLVNLHEIRIRIFIERDFELMGCKRTPNQQFQDLPCEISGLWVANEHQISNSDIYHARFRAYGLETISKSGEFGRMRLVYVNAKHKFSALFPR